MEGNALESTLDESNTGGPIDKGGTSVRGDRLVIGYGDEPVIDGESIVVPSGSVTALIGPNGSGKSTLLKTIANQLRPESGSVLLDGREIHEFNSTELATKLGLLSQERTAPESVTAEDLVYHGRYPHRGFFEAVSEDDRRAVEEAIELAGVEALRDRELGSLSGGQKQLAWIAMALAQDTDVLLLDEPTTFLDLHHQLSVMRIVDRLNEQTTTTIVLVLHDIEQACRHASYLCALDDGRIYDSGDPVDVVTEALLADVFEVDANVYVRDGRPRIDPQEPL